MTRSTGKREKQRRREELFGAELTLRRILLHVLSTAAWARRMRDVREQEAQGDAWEIVYARMQQIVKEQAEL